MNIVRVIIYLVSVGCVQAGGEDAPTKERDTYQKVRCSRRFSPGSCLEPVRPVWTYVAPLQTCTERLGCPTGLYSNRFSTFEACQTMCKELMYLFMYLQSLDNDTFRVPDEGGPGGASSTEHSNVDIVYNEMISQNRKEPDSEEQESYVDTGDEKVSRNFLAALSHLPDPNADYTVERKHDAGDYLIQHDIFSFQ